MKYILGITTATLLFIGGLYVVSSNQVSVNNSAETTQATSEKLSIVTSFYPLQFALERIVGELGTVINVGEGKDPHDFEPTMQNILAMQQAKMVVLQGADFEPWGDSVVDRLKSDGVRIVLATSNLELREGHYSHEHEDDLDDHSEDKDHTESEGDQDTHKDGDGDGDEAHNEGEYDPHTWLDPVLFSQTVNNITQELVLIDPSNASIFQENSSALRAELNDLNQQYKDRLASCSLDEVITSHDAFSYVAERYGFEVHSIAGLSTQDTPSAIVLADLKQEAEEGISAILLEQNSITAYGETLARETGLETITINPIAYLVPPGENYLTLMQKNLDTFAKALNCNE